MQHPRIANFSSECCTICFLNTDHESFRVFSGETLHSFAASVSIEEFETSSARIQWKKTGTRAIATWKSRWLLLCFPHGRAHIYELINSNRVVLNSTIDCPINTCCTLLLDDDVEGCALVVYGTDEGASSKIEVARLTLTSESMSVMPLKSWKCRGSVSSLASYGHGRCILIGYSSCSGIDLLDPFSFEIATSPSTMSNTPRLNKITLQRQLSLPLPKTVLSTATETTSSAPVTPSTTPIIENADNMVENISLGDGVPVWVFTMNTPKQQLITLTRCGTIAIYRADDDDHLKTPSKFIYLNFDTIGVCGLNTDKDIVVCGWRGELALIDTETASVARFARTRANARVDDFNIVYNENRMFLLQTDADDGNKISIFDFGRACLLGTSKKINNFLESATDSGEDDELIFLQTDDSPTKSSTTTTIPTANNTTNTSTVPTTTILLTSTSEGEATNSSEKVVNNQVVVLEDSEEEEEEEEKRIESSKSAKEMMRTAWELMVEETSPYDM